MPEFHDAVISLSDVGDVDGDLVGGKAGGFAVIARAGLRAPDGFVITTVVHRAAAGGAGWTIPTAVERRVRDLVTAMGGSPLAVRSSATGEDGADHSHAGQYATRLGVRGPDAVLAAVVECWESASDARARAYRAQRGHGGDVAMAVIVQRLANGEAAGVAMSCDPISGARDVLVVNAAFGLGETVVSGLVTPDDYRIARDDGRLVRFEPGVKDVMIVMGDEGPTEVPVEPDLHEERVLADRQLAEIRDGLLRCERELGRPADCEFSVVSGEILWLQCRPMTALDDPTPAPA